MGDYQKCLKISFVELHYYTSYHEQSLQLNKLTYLLYSIRFKNKKWLKIGKIKWMGF